MKSDASRIADLNMIYSALQNRSISTARKQYLQQMMDRILRESKATRELRDKLVMATKSGDVYAKKYYINELVRIRQEETGGGKDYLNIRI